MGFGQATTKQNRLISPKWWPTILGLEQATSKANIALSRRDRTILRFGQATTKQNRLISPRKGDFGVWAGHHKAKSLYLAEMGRFWGLGRPPQSKIALSRRDRTILGFGQATTKQNRLISPRWDDFGAWSGHHKAKSPYLAEIGRFWGLGRPPQSKIALSRRDRTILGFGQATTKQNRLISPR